jgi:lipopolysaccharide biosynthesis glycosyltransferase
MIRLFLGFDEREAAGSWLFTSSALRHTTLPMSITPLHLPSLKGYTETHGDGTNAFIYTRFLVPFLCDYQGFALFVDGADMLCRGDLAELWAMRDVFKAVQVVKHDYQTQYLRKYVGTPMEADNRHYPRKNWSSVMLMNCAHYAWRKITPQTLPNLSGEFLHRFQFLADDLIGALPPEWNHLVLEQEHDPDAKLVHFTLGIPGFKHYKNSPFAGEWFGELGRMNDHV